MHCKTCHYSLAGLSEHRCPECGTPFDPNDFGAEPPFEWGRLLGRISSGYVIIFVLYLIHMAILPEKYMDMTYFRVFAIFVTVPLMICNLLMLKESWLQWLATTLLIGVVTLFLIPGLAR